MTKQKVVELGAGTGIYLIDDFLTPQECKAIIAMAKESYKHQGPPPGFKKPDFFTGGYIANLQNKSNVTLNRIRDRIVGLTKIHKEQMELHLILHYKLGGGSDRHIDYFSDKKRAFPRRTAQMLFYLNEVEEGGETEFPHLGVKITPRKGRAVLWYNIKGLLLPGKGAVKAVHPKVYRTNPYAWHAVDPVTKGEKWVFALTLLDKKPTQEQILSSPYLQK